MTKKIGLRNKITTSIVLTILLLGLSISFMMNVIVQDILREQLMGKGVFIARSLSARSTLPILTENWFDLKYFSPTDVEGVLWGMKFFNRLVPNFNFF